MHFKKKLKLRILVQRGVNEEVNEPTDGVSQLVIFKKSDVGLRIYNDPQIFQRERYSLYVSKDIRLT